MKKVLIFLSTMLLALSCSKMPDVPVVDLAKLAAGIGGGSGTDIDEDVDTETPSVCGNITISGGTVMASGNSILSSAGIGTGARGSVGSITITNGVTQVTVKKVSDSAPHSIGGGADYTRIGTVTVGGKVGPVSESPFVYKP